MLFMNIFCFVHVVEYSMIDVYCQRILSTIGTLPRRPIRLIKEGPFIPDLKDLGFLGCFL